MRSKLIVIGFIAFALFLIFYCVKNPKGKSIFSYKVNPSDYGAGVENLGLEQPQTTPIVGTPFGPRYAIQKAFAPLSSAQGAAPVQSLPWSDLRANGAYLSGDLRLLPLSNEGQK